MLVRLIAVTTFCIAAAVASAAQAPPVAAVSPFVDVHVHMEKPVVDDSIQAAIRSAPIENVAKYLFLPSPFDEEGPASFDVEFIAAEAKKHSANIAISGGGGTLNPMLDSRFMKRSDSVF